MTRISDKRRNARLALPLAGIVAGMVMLAYASVPLYRLFCQVTGFGGTTQVAEQAAAGVLDREMTIRFDANTNPGLPWSFQPVQREMRVKVGEQNLAFYRAMNNSRRPVVGTATYNVTPLKAGAYFSKIECFCFTEQRLDPGQSMEFPVSFFVDPAIAQDRSLDDVGTITLSYTFFRDEGVDQQKTAQVSRSAAETAGARKE